MSREAHVRFCESLGVRLPGATHRVFGFENKRTAQHFLQTIVERFARFGLTLNLDKTRLIEFDRFAEINCRRRGQGRPATFDFLGFIHCCGTNRQGRFQVIGLTAKKRMRTTLAVRGGTPSF